jgi:hypothetical protein
MSKPTKGQVAVGVDRKSKALRESANKRLELLQRILHTQQIPQGFAGTSIETFFKWEDPALGIIPIGSPNTVKTYDLSLYLELKRMLKRIRDLPVTVDREKQKAKRQSDWQKRIRELEHTNQALTDDLLTLRVAFTKLVKELENNASKNSLRAEAAKRYRSKYALHIVDDTEHET